MVTSDTTKYIDLTVPAADATTLTHEQHTDLLNKQLAQYKQLLISNIQQYTRATLRSVTFESTHSLTKLKQLLHNTVRTYHSVEGLIYDDYKSLKLKQIQYNKLCAQRDALADECSELHKIIEYARSKQRRQSMLKLKQQQSDSLDGNCILTEAEITPERLYGIKLQYEKQLQQIELNSQQLQRYTDECNNLLQKHSKQLQGEQNEYNTLNAQLQQLLTVDAAARHTREYKLKQLVDTHTGLLQYAEQCRGEIVAAQDNVAKMNENLAALAQQVGACQQKIATVKFTHSALIDSVRTQWRAEHHAVAECCADIVQSFHQLTGLYDTALHNIQLKDSSKDTSELPQNVLYRLFAERYAVSQSQVQVLAATCQRVIDTIKKN